MVVSNTLKKIRQKFNDYVSLDSWSDGRLILEPSDRHSSDDTLEHTFQDYFQDFTMFSEALVKCSSKASFYNHSTTMKEELFRRQNETGNKENSIEQQVSTRWNSTYMMVESIIKNLDHVNLILSRDAKHKNLQLKSNEAEVLEESLEVLKTFFEITNQLSYEKTTTLSLIIPAFRIINKSVEFSVEDKRLTTGLKKILKLYIDSYIDKYKIFDNSILALATFLNPKYKKFSNSSEEKKKIFTEMAEKLIRDKISDFKEEMFSQNHKDSNPNKKTTKINRKFQMSDSSEEENELEFNWRAVKKEITSYKLEFKHSDMIEFWSENKNKYPILFQYFKIYATAPATNTPSKRIFSKTGYQIWDRRNKISPDKVDKIMFL